MKSRTAIFVSGRGSNLQSLLSDGLAVALVVSSNSKAYAVKRARRFGIPVLILDKKIDWSKLEQDLRRYRINRIFLLGFMKLLPASFVQNWQSCLYNVHPSLLPAFPGLNSIEKSHAAGAAMGVTVHKVIAEMDAGEILLQEQILEARAIHSLTLQESEFLIHKAEQILIRKATRHWR